MKKIIMMAMLMLVLVSSIVAVDNTQSIMAGEGNVSEQLDVLDDWIEGIMDPDWVPDEV